MANPRRAASGKELEMKFLADMGLSQTTVTWLREHGHDVVHLRDLGMCRAGDNEIVDLARAQGRVVLTFDLDFGDIMAASRKRLPSVLIFRLYNGLPLAVNKRLDQVIQESYIALSAGALIIVEDARHGVRLLPIK